MSTAQSTQLIDTTGNTHTLEVVSTGIWLDGKLCRLVVRENQILLVSSDPGTGVIPVAPASFWRAFAGGDPTPESAGVAQAHALAHWVALQDLSQVMMRVQSLLHDLERHLQPFSEAPLPAYRFDPFTIQLLRTYDGTEEHVAAVAKLLKQPPETIRLWLASVGLMGVSDQEKQEPLLQEETVPVSVLDVVTPPIVSQGKTFRWTPSMIQQLTEAFLASDEPSISAVSRTIAGKHDWPIQSVEYKIYHLDLPRQREQRHQQHAEASDATEGDETEAGISLSLVPDLDDGMNHHPAPVHLVPGNFLWDVQIDEKKQRWQLESPYSQFPHVPGTHVLYREQEYLLQKVWHSLLVVTPVVTAEGETEENRTALQLATV